MSTSIAIGVNYLSLFIYVIPKISLLIVLFFCNTVVIGESTHTTSKEIMVLSISLDLKKMITIMLVRFIFITCNYNWLVTIVICNV